MKALPAILLSVSISGTVDFQGLEKNRRKFPRLGKMTNTKER
jgi:hypothetical protein